MREFGFGRFGEVGEGVIEEKERVFFLKLEERLV